MPFFGRQGLALYLANNSIAVRIIVTVSRMLRVTMDRRDEHNMIAHGINLETDAVREFCRKWRIRELCVFGSILRDDFRPDSDIDFLVDFEEYAEWDFEARMEMEEELERIVRRPVDIATSSSLKWVIRERVTQSAKVVHAAR
jgi:uncharacterized protein